MLNIETPKQKLSEDVKEYLKNRMTRNECAQLVYYYYSMQEQRISNLFRATKLKERGESYSFFEMTSEINNEHELFIKKALSYFAKHNEICNWMTSLHGIGPVISCVLFSELSVKAFDKKTERYKRVETAGGFWKYCGIATPDQVRKKGQLVNFNPDMKRICWLLGKSFVLVSGNPDAYYGQVYKNRKILETELNEQGKYSELAKQILIDKNIKDEATKTCLESGKLTKGHIDARARRYAVKLFLAHLHEVMYGFEYKEAPPKPYIIAFGEHAHYIPPPNAVKEKTYYEPKWVYEPIGEDFGIDILGKED